MAGRPKPKRLYFALLLQAVRALLRHKTRSALTVLGVTIGISAVVWVVGLGEAGSQRAQDELRKLGENLVWVEAGSRNLAGVRTGTNGANNLMMSDAEAILREVPGIARMSPQIDGSVQVAFGTSNWSTRFRGVAPDYLPIKRWEVETGAAISDSNVEHAENVCLLGATVAARLFGAASPIGESIRLSGQLFVVIGTLKAKGQSPTGQDQDDTLFVPYTTAQKKLRPVGATWLDDIVCSAVSPEAVAPAAAQVVELMRERHHIIDREDDFNIRHPEDVVKAQMEANEVFTNLLVSIGSVALLVGGVGVMNVMLASVAERTREIGIRRAVGATAFAVQYQFLCEAVVLTTFGGVMGSLVSVAGAFAIERLIGWPIAIPIAAFVVAAAFSVLVGVIFGFYPAWRASRLDPIEALRTD